MNKKYSLGGAFGISSTEGFIVSGSEDGDILFWDVRSKEVVQRVSGHEGVVCWVDTSPGPSCMVVSAGLDGTVRIWVDVNEDEEGVNGMSRLNLEQENVADGYLPEPGVDEDMKDIKVENGAGFDDTPKEMSLNGDGSPERRDDEAHGDGVDKMEED